MYENKVKKFENENHVVTVWEDLSTGKRCIEVIDTLDDGSSVYVETKEEVVALLEMLVKAVRLRPSPVYVMDEMKHETHKN